MWALLMAAALTSTDGDFETAYRDWSSLTAEDQYHTRYLSTYAVNPEARPQLNKATAFWVNSLSSKKLIRRPLQVSDTLMRVDLRDYGWSVQAWRNLAQRDPYYSDDCDGLVLRADWFLVETSDGTRSLAYYDFLYGVGKAPNLDQFRAAWAFDAKAVAKFGLAQRQIVDTGDSIVARHHRVLERGPTILGAAWQSYDAAQASPDRDPVERLLDFTFDAGEFIYTMPNGLPAYLLTNAQGVRVEFADPAIARDSSDPVDARVRNPRSCVVCHAPVSGLHIPKHLLPEILQAGVSIKTYDKRTKELLEEFYLSDDGRKIRADQSDYATAVKKCNGLTPETNALAYTESLRGYEAPVTLEQAAREVCLTTEEFVARCEKTASGRLSGLIKGRPVPREVWETATYLQAKVLVGIK